MIRQPQVVRTSGTATSLGTYPARQEPRPHVPTLVVAAVNSTEADKATADYIASGESDQTTIQTAINELPRFGSEELFGLVLLCEGVFTVTGEIIVPSDWVEVAGCGPGTIIQVLYPAAAYFSVVVFARPGGGEG